jgi:hypothetical protein
MKQFQTKTVAIFDGKIVDVATFKQVLFAHGDKAVADFNIIGGDLHVTVRPPTYEEERARGGHR